MAMALCVSSCGIGFDNGGVSPDAPSVITTDGKADIDNCHIEITDCKAQISAFYPHYKFFQVQELMNF